MLRTLLLLLISSVGLLWAADGLISETPHAEYRVVIGALATVVVVQYWQAAREREAHSKSEAEISRLCGELSLLLRQIPDHLKSHSELVQRIAVEFRDCTGHCAAAQESMRTLADRYRDD